VNATIKDVAKAAGVSVASVSRALNGRNNVTEETRRRVLEAAARLRYTPNDAARSLITRRTRTIAAVLPDLYGEFFSELIRGMDTAARTHGLHLLVAGARGSAQETASVLRALSGRVDGLLVMSPHADAELLGANLPASLPTVLMNTRLSGAQYSTLSIDNYGGAHAMTRHLLERGHRHIAFIAGPLGNLDAAERLRGYREALKQQPDASEIVVPGDFSEESGYRAALRIGHLEKRPQAIFAANDMMAIGCLFGLGEIGFKVPGDVALAGFDDIPTARYVTPPLSTVRVSIAELGSRALQGLAAAIETPGSPPFTEELGCELVIRRSCGADTS
jgi:LacI family transcriptional regulator